MTEPTADYSLEDLKRALIQLKIPTGSIVFSHANIGFFGKLLGAKTPHDYYEKYKCAMMEALGPNGTWVLPTFSYSFCWGKEFDVDNTPGVCGFLSEAMRKDPDAHRSIDPNFSVTAIGALARELTQNAPVHSFGPNSFWDRLVKKNGWIVNFNRDAASTLVHFVEKELSVSYRFDKEFRGSLIQGSQRIEKTFTHFVAPLDRPDLQPEFTKFHRQALKKGLARLENLGKGQIVSISARDTVELIKGQIAIDPHFMTVGPT